MKKILNTLPSTFEIFDPWIKRSIKQSTVERDNWQDRLLSNSRYHDITREPRQLRHPEFAWRRGSSRFRILRGRSEVAHSSRVGLSCPQFRFSRSSSKLTHPAIKPPLEHRHVRVDTHISQTEAFGCWGLVNFEMWKAIPQPITITSYNLVWARARIRTRSGQ